MYPVGCQYAFSSIGSKFSIEVDIIPFVLFRGVVTH
jgi:hypothetical protein